MYFILLISMVAGVLAISLRRHRVVRRLAAGAAILFAVIAIFLDWWTVWSVTTLGSTAAAIAFLILVVIALVLPRRHAEWIQTNVGLPPTELPSSTPGRFPTFYRTEPLAAVHNGLRDSFERRGRSVADADVMFERLIANLRVLENLYMLIVRASLGDADARTQFQISLQYLAQRFPAYRGSLKSLRDRVSKAPSTLNARGPCAIVTLPGMASIYSSIYTVGGPSGANVQSALDVIAGLSLGQSNLEVLSGSLTHDGPDGLDAMIDFGESTGSPYFTPFGPRHRENFTNPSPDKPEGRSGGLGPFVDLLPDEVYPLDPDACEMVREVCESMLVDAVTQGASFEAGVQLTPALPACSVSNIERLELATPQPGRSGKCAGDTLTIHGSNFGDRPNGRVVVLNVRGECARLNVSSWWSSLRVDRDTTIALPPEFTPYWSDTMIRFSLPQGITPGPVGIFDVNSIDTYNAWSSGVSRRVQEVEVSSKCLDKPLTGGNVATPADTHIRTPLAPDYTPCPARTDHNVLEEVGAAVILSFRASAGRGSDQSVMADPDDELTLEWNVINATSITLTRLGIGPYFNGNAEVVDPPGTSWSFGRLGHSGPGVYHYQLSARDGNNCGYVTAMVKVFASKRPRLGIDAFEVTQGIQKVDNSVPLVEKKPTVVRVFANHGFKGFDGETSVSPVGGRLRVIGAGGRAVSGWLDPINSVTSVNSSPLPPGSILLKASPSRAEANDTLNFRIPNGLCTGTIGVEAEVFVDGFGAIGGSTGFSERASARRDGITFQRRRQLKIRFIPVELIPDPNNVLMVAGGVSNPPTDEDCRNFILRSLKFIPANADVSRLEGWSAKISIATIVITTPFGPFTPPRLLPITSTSPDFDVQANAFLEFLGLHHDPEDGEIWMVLVPSLTTWGRTRSFSPECLTRMTEDSAAHELAHCLNQEHISLKCPDGKKASGGDTPEQWGEDGGAVVDVPFDIESKDTVTSSSGVFELMTYCATRWTSPQRWQRLFDFIGE